ncbi:MAG TPA: AMP-binding protein [Pseudonocardiaceae bacterium]
MTTLALLSARPEQARLNRENGWWRDETFLDDLAAWVRVRPDAPAFVTGRSREGTVRTVTYKEYDQQVRRVAAGLYDLGVRTGDVVAFQLPDWWETAAMFLACMRVGAIAQPMVPELRGREIERVLGRTSARICVIIDEWAGFDHSAALQEMAYRLPHLRHRVVYGDSARTGALDFHRDLVNDHRDDDLSMLPPLDPDRACLVLFTSGSTGEAKGVLHSSNTIYAGSRGMTDATTSLAPGVDRAAATLKISHIAGPLWMLFGTLLSGGAAVFQDMFDADELLDLMEAAGVTRLLSTPPKLAALLDAQRRRGRPIESLHTVCAGGTTIPPDLVPQVRDVFDVPLRSVWGMTEIVVGTVVGQDDPEDWSAHSDGRALPGLELRVVTPDGGPGAGSLQVRGASLCLGTVTKDIGDVTPPTDTEDGWFDTGDLAREDGRGGIRIVGRTADRIYDPSANFMIPVRDLEDELMRHPLVHDVAIVACRMTAEDGAPEDVLAVVVPAGDRRPTLPELCAHLDECGMTSWYHPTRLEFQDSLPRDPLGKIRKYQLRDHYDALVLAAG